eukprot:365847-Chlamydomonas_euryale.AAC.42
MADAGAHSDTNSRPLGPAHPLPDTWGVWVWDSCKCVAVGCLAVMSGRGCSSCATPPCYPSAVDDVACTGAASAWLRHAALIAGPVQGATLRTLVSRVWPGHRLCARSTAGAHSGRCRSMPAERVRRQRCHACMCMAVHRCGAC